MRIDLCFGALIGLVACASPHPVGAQADSGTAEAPRRNAGNFEPDFEDLIGLASVGSQRISPDGRSVAFVRATTDMDENRYDREIWLARGDEEPFQLTRTVDGSSGSPKWSPDGEWLAFSADRGDNSQLHLIRVDGGEAFPITGLSDGGPGGFEWSPDGTAIAFTLSEPEDEDLEAREELYGGFWIEDAENRLTHLWVLDIAAAIEAEGEVDRPKEDSDEDGDDEEEEEEEEDAPSALRRLTGGDEFTVGGFSWSPDGTDIAFDHRPDTLIESGVKGDISVVDVESGDVRLLVDTKGSDGSPRWSPDGAWILFGTGNGKEPWFYNNELARIPSGGGAIEVLTAEFDENPRTVTWSRDGIFFLASQRTEGHLFQLNPETHAISRVGNLPNMISSVDASPDGRHFAFVSESPSSLREISRWSAGSSPKTITNVTAQVSDWALGKAEVITWKSEDGAEIEGVLYKPDDFDPDVKYPLLVVIHGGPTGTSRPSLVNSYVYPVTQWVNKGALVLMPNYRGSAGYGEAFRMLNVRNLGVGDAWDVLSGVDHLVAQGIVDDKRMGAMGWSQGGYISAFLTTTSDRFAAISMGAGISNWMTYYVNTDIHPFTRYYLGATPWEDPEVYAKTSPMTYINNAKTPTMIQHGEFDRRVPIPNAYELYQGLQDVGVEAKLVVYKGFGHGISKPKERLAATWHNWQWFAEHIWGEEVEIPLEADD